MSNLNLNQFIQNNAQVKVHFQHYDLSQPGAVIAQADLSFIMNAKLDATAISTYFDAVYLDGEDRPRSYSTVLLDLASICSNDSNTVRIAIKNYLLEVQMNIFQDLFAQDKFDDAEIDAIDEAFPGLLAFNSDISDFTHLAFKTLPTLYHNTTTGMGIANEWMYAFTDKVVAYTLFNVVKTYFNADACYDDFIEYASELINKAEKA